MGNLIDKQAAIDAVERITSSMSVCVNLDECHGMKRMQRQAVIELTNLPSAQSEIIRCKDCKHWKKTCGDESWSVGDCDVFDKKLVMCKGFCAWAERRTDATTI